ncbi:hypothetical protein BLA60_08490 [Actinophytocola xinjiangensis]|uniref:AMP-dependent synthetase/ligase domain-containing protein n=2 Tax=Actinophytocola xinjiangensis TaxID=485602 RepID=A0A7Z1AZG2_9PSEU|nr:hypothetical protein BLA60_08490 [Actinophytocola xinjiangensis]
MAMVTAEQVRSSVGAWTISRLLRRDVTVHGHLPALTGADGVTRTWSQLGEEVLAVAGGLSALGLRRGERMLLGPATRPEHWVVDLASVQLGAIPCTVDAALGPDQLHRIARDSGATVVVLTGPAELTRWAPALAAMPALRGVVVLDGDGHTRYADLLTAGHDAPLTEDSQDDPVAVVHTVADPAGVVVSHRDVLHRCVTQELARPTAPHPRTVAHLPLTHVEDRVLGLYLPVYSAGHVTVCQDPDRLAETLTTVAPQAFLGAPPAWERLATLIRHVLSTVDCSVPADETVLAPLRARLGLDGTVRFGGGAPPEVLDLLAGLGLPVGGA